MLSMKAHKIDSWIQRYILNFNYVIQTMLNMRHMYKNANILVMVAKEREMEKCKNNEIALRDN